MNLFQSSDIFALGVGFDIGGGYLVARGLLISPAAILRRSLNDEHYFIPEDTAALISDRVDALLGILALLLGFGLQVAGYALSAGGFAGWGHMTSGLLPGTVVVGAAVLGSASVVACWRMARWRLTRQLIVRVASDPLTLGPNYTITLGGAKPPSGIRLERLGALFGRNRVDDESLAEYAVRVYGVDEITETDGLATAFHPARIG